jgi:mannose/fructose-specific phosphotransferase system component IIA
MPYDKDDFITRAQDPSSREFKMLNETIEKHLNDIIKNKKMSFNGEFQELSRDLTEKRKQTNAANAEKKPSTRTAAGKTTTAKTTAGKTTTSSKTTTGKTTGAKKNETSAAGANATDEVKKPSTRTASGKTTTGKTNAVTAANGRPSAANNEEAPSVSMDTAKKTEKPIINPDTEKTDERPSFTKEVSEFIKKNIIEKKPALVLVDTFLGTVVDKAKKIVRTGKTIAAAFVIATNVLAPNLQMPTIEHLSRIPTPNAISISVNQNDFKSAAQGTVKTGGQARQAQHAQSAKSAARR